jgi:hypothetical protein
MKTGESVVFRLLSCRPLNPASKPFYWAEMINQSEGIAMKEDLDPYNEAAEQAVELANDLADKHQDADLWDIADGVLAGAVHYWLYARQPCEDPMCEDCSPNHTPEERLVELLRLVEEFAKDSDYFLTANDHKIGRA